jgi:hypothetical protein
MDSILGIRVSIAAIVLGIVLFHSPQAKADRPSLLTDNQASVASQKL